ncbi:MAG TPA: hypothetical protein VIY29_19605 [Ktedonobacteraceae bacterium]
MQGNLFHTHPLIRTCFGALAALALMLLFAACGSNASTTSSSGGGPYGHGGGTTPTVSSSSSQLKTATATVSGTSETILTNAQGMTLYYRTSDIPPSTVCSGGCAGAWPPLVVSGSGAPTSAATLPGQLTTVADANGNQVEYNGHPLYTFSGDTAPGQTTGNAVAGVWFVVTPDLKPQGTPQATPTQSGY